MAKPLDGKGIRRQKRRTGPDTDNLIGQQGACAEQRDKQLNHAYLVIFKTPPRQITRLERNEALASVYMGHMQEGVY